MDNRGSGNILGQNSGSGSKFMFSICIHNIVPNRSLYLFTYLIVQRTSSSIICGMYSWTAGGLDPIYTCLILCSSCVENKFIDYLRDVQLDRWLDWTLERDQEPYTSQVHILYSRVADPE